MATCSEGSPGWSSLHLIILRALPGMTSLWRRDNRLRSDSLTIFMVSILFNGWRVKVMSKFIGNLPVQLVECPIGRDIAQMLENAFGFLFGDCEVACVLPVFFPAFFPAFSGDNLV